MKTTITLDDANIILPHLSYSAVRDFMCDRRQFRKKWIDHDYSREPDLKLIEGTAFHAGVETYWSQVFEMRNFDNRRSIPPKVDTAVISDHILKQIQMDYPDSCARLKKRISKAEVPDYQLKGCAIFEKKTEGRTGRVTTTIYAELTIEAIYTSVYEGVLSYIEQRPPEFYRPLAIEYSVKGITEDAETGENHKVPLKVRLDLLAETQETEMVLVDHKYMGDDPDVDEAGNIVVTPSMKLQGTAMVSSAKNILESLGMEGSINKVIFDVFNKKTKEMTQVIVEIGRKELVLWSRIYRSVEWHLALAYAAGDFDTFFLPNPDGIYGDMSGWREFETDIEYALAGEERPKPKDKIEYDAVEL